MSAYRILTVRLIESRWPRSTQRLIRHDFAEYPNLPSETLCLQGKRYSAAHTDRRLVDRLTTTDQALRDHVTFVGYLMLEITTGRKADRNSQEPHTRTERQAQSDGDVLRDHEGRINAENSKREEQRGGDSDIDPTRQQSHHNDDVEGDGHRKQGRNEACSQ